MKAALIPPKGYYRKAFKSDIHLILAHVRDHVYRDVYSTAVLDDDYVILDNGAAEGSPVTDDVLLAAAAFYGADEIVLPDVIRDAELTLERIDAFLKANPEIASNTMAVAQGNDEIAVKQCIDKLANHSGVDVIGIPRHMITTLGDQYARYRLCEYIENAGIPKPVHLLGTNPIALQELVGFSKLFPWVRSVDTSLPFNYSIAGERLDAVQAACIRRPDDYFEKEWEIGEDLLDQNIDIYLRWASGTEGARS